jgi:alkylhydroperoxidase/carboxymuconolactone decarboxylase family protein YurZ
VAPADQGGSAVTPTSATSRALALGGWLTYMTHTTSGPSGAQKAFGDFAHAFVGFTDEVLFGQVWTRPELSPKERSLITVAALTAGGSTEQLTFHLQLAGTTVPPKRS